MKKLILALTALLLPGQAQAYTWKQITSQFTQSVVYLEALNEKGEVTESGTGFIVSHDGYIATAAHVKPRPGGKLLAVIGQRVGLQYPLEYRDADEADDVALWKLPQAAVCRPSVIISTKPINVLDRVLALGFPGTDGLTPARLGIINRSTPERGFYRADAYIWPGFSGGPVFNENGRVIAIVQGGTMPGTGRNDLVPISLLTNLLRKRGVEASYDEPRGYDISCYQTCPNPSKIVGWAVQHPWNSGSSGWIGGGHNRTQECNKMVAAFKASHPGVNIEITSTGENHKKDLLGHVEYEYFCSGTMRSGPKYAVEPGPHCPLKQ